MMNKGKVLLITVVICIIHICTIYVESLSQEKYVKVEKGVLDVTKWNFEKDGAVPLNGQWEFIPDGSSSSQYVNVPSQTNFFSNTSDLLYHHGTYKLTILLPPSSSNIYSLKVMSIFSAHRLFVDNTLVASQGNFSQHELYKQENKPYTISFKEDRTELHLAIEMSNLESLSTNGIVRPIYFGDSSSIEKKNLWSSTTTFAYIFTIVIFAFIYMITYHWKKQIVEKAILLLFCFFTILFFSVQDEKFIFILFPNISFDVSQKLVYIAGLFINIFLCFYVFSKNRNYFPRILPYIVSGINALFVCALFGSLSFLTEIVAYELLVYAVINGYLLFHSGKQAIQKGGEILYEYMFLLSFNLAYAVGSIQIVDYQSFHILWVIQLFLFGVVSFFIMMRNFFLAQKRTEKIYQELVDTNGLKDKLLRITSYEFLNPINALHNIVYEVKGKRPRDRNLQVILDVTNQLRKLSNDIGDLSHVSSSQDKINHTSVLSLRLLIRHALLVCTSNRYTNDTCSIQVPEYVLIRSNQEMMHQVLVHLIRANSQYANKRTIMFSVTVRDNYVTIFCTVEGIPNVLLEESADYKLIVALLESIGSELTVSFSNQKVIFQFTVPLAKAKEEKKESEVNLSTESAETIILLIEQDSLVRFTLQRALTLEHFAVVAPRTKEEALMLLKSYWKYDMILLDFHFRGCSSLEVCQAIRKTHSLLELPIIMHANQQKNYDVMASYAVGANDYILKYADISELKARIHIQLALKKSVSDKVNMEVAFLQAQIQPHFLFNSLNAIAALSEINHDKMTELLIQFGYYLRESFKIDNTKPCILLQKEMNLVEAYLSIEKVRFQERLEYSIEIDVDSSLLVPPLSIQPLVENAVRHGISKKEEGGHVLVKVEEYGEKVKIVVQDNGVGMTEEQIYVLLSLQHSGGVGITNVHKRLMQRFGTGLHVQSTIGEGTIVTFTIPKQR